jgi:hypothetical protein
VTKAGFSIRSWRAALLLTATLFGCSLLSKQEQINPTPNIVPLDTPTQPPAQTSTTTLMNEFTEGYFITSYPAWPRDQNRPADSLLGVAQGPFGVWVNRYGVLPRQASRDLQKSLANQPGATLISETRRGEHLLLEYDFPVQTLTLRYQTLLVYCQNQTYVVAVAGEAQQFVDFLCYLDLRHNDGTPKAGWSAWQESAATYLADYASPTNN